MNSAARLLLSDIVFWGERLASHVEGMAEDDFSASELASDAACWCLLCIGEAAGSLHRIDPTLASVESALELVKAYGMRNRLAHDYGGIDLGVVWLAATVSVPNMVRAAKEVLNGQE
jgi:uncharacterized protein with HEPN domain